MDPIEDMFKSMIEAPPQGQTGNGIKVAGDFLVEVKATKPNKGYHGNRLIVEFKVLESTSPDEVPVGCTRSWGPKWGDEKALSDLKAFGLAVAGPALEGLSQREKDATATYMVYAAAGQLLAGTASDVARKKLGEDGKPFEGDPFVGLRARVSTMPTKTKLGFDFVKHRWSAA